MYAEKVLNYLQVQTSSKKSRAETNQGRKASVRFVGQNIINKKKEFSEDNDDNDDKEEGDEKEYEKEYDDDSFSSAESERRSPFPSKVLFSRSKNIIDDMDYAMKKMSLRDKKPSLVPPGACE